MFDDEDELDGWEADDGGDLSDDEADLEPEPDEEAFDLENDEAEPEPGDFWFETDDSNDD